jgi:methyl-accepting chemotaxis protein
VISDNMIDGYNSLSTNITTTIDLINDVSVASKEQQQAMVQINETINMLDSQTQKNASIAQSAHSIANETQTMAQEIVNKVSEKKF